MCSRTGHVASPSPILSIHGWLSMSLREYECDLRMIKLSVKYLLYTDDQVILAPSEYELQKLSTSDGRHGGDIDRRVIAGNIVNGTLLAIMNSKSGSRQARFVIHNGVLIPMLMYGSESWVWQKKNKNRINPMEMRSLRTIYRVSLKNRYRDSDVRKRWSLKEDVRTRVEKDMLRWFGHV
ncbi:hypothetical protein EVAR_10144_1 [Eumeta japonica]|uniref:Reverse transcriptase domain-containing protein n=1 Tax=Eumeta variegata TaxID=151549 RepID=A0A4C1UC34_EUMVA|nr:hypothetical protein EVAR_10144_1 [Eumeta japonica]